MSYALLFSGQGLQHADMLPWLADEDGWRAAMADPAGAARNAFAQPALTRLALAAWDRLSPQLPAPAAVAGYSVGELAAFSVAGAFDGRTALDLAATRAALMDACAAGGPPTGLVGVSGVGPSVQARLCEGFGLEVAIRADAFTVVLGGPREALARAADAAAEAGGQVTPLRVALASHTPWMRGAAEAFAQVMRHTAVAVPHLPLFCNRSGGRPASVDAVRAALAEQIDHPLRWDQVMQSVAERGVSCVLEIGGGAALARQWNRHFPDVPARAADEFRSVAAVTAWLQRAGG